MEEQEDIMMYIHNNIHLILGEKGLSPHFYGKVIKYLECFMNVDDIQNGGDQLLTVEFLSKIFEKSPLTANKLIAHLQKQSHRIYLPNGLSRFVIYLTSILDSVCSQLKQVLLPYLSNRVESMIEPEMEASLHNRIESQLQSMIQFASLLAYAVSQQENKERRP